MAANPGEKAVMVLREKCCAIFPDTFGVAIKPNGITQNISNYLMYFLNI